MSDIKLDLVREVTVIVERLGHPQGDDPDLYPMTHALAALPGVDARRPLDIHYREYVVRTALGDDLGEEQALLARIRQLNIAAAPEPVALLPTVEGQVSIVRYWACPGEELRRLDETKVPLRPEAIERVRHDIRVLTDAGLFHPYARGTYHWWIADPSGTLVLERWGVARQGSDTERSELVESVESMLQRRAGA
jgi:hypothetical protein